MRGRSYTPSPPPHRGYGRRGRSPSPRGRRGGRGGGGGGGRDLPTSLLVRNLRHDCRPEDLRRPFGQFGPLKDIYLPRDYYTGSEIKVMKTSFKEPRGFGFVQFVDPSDATEAKYQMDGQILLGRELTVVFAEENRKKPVDMRARERVRGSHDRRRSPPRYSRSMQYSLSPPPRRGRSRSLSGDYYSPSPKRRLSRSPSPRRRSSREKQHSRYSRDRSYSLSRSRSPPQNGTRGRSRSTRRRSCSPVRVGERGRSRSLSPSRIERPSLSPNPRGYSREPDQSRSP